MYIIFYLLHEEPCNVDVANKSLLLIIIIINHDFKVITVQMYYTLFKKK